MKDSFFERFVSSDEPGWFIARTVVVGGPLFAGVLLAITVFLDAWRQ